MKKVLCTSLVLLMILSGITVAFAANSGSTTAAAAGATTTASAVSTTGSAVDTTGAAVSTTGTAIDTTETAIGTTGAAVTVSNDMTFTGTPIKLSLDAAYKKVVADSSGAKMADLYKQKDLGTANGYGESVRMINKNEDLEKNPRKI